MVIKMYICYLLACIILAVLHPTCPNMNISLANLSDCSNYEESEQLDSISKAEPGDIVELSAVDDGFLWIRAVKFDEKYESLLVKIKSIVPPVIDQLAKLGKYTMVLVKCHEDFSRGIVINDDQVGKVTV